MILGRQLRLVPEDTKEAIGGTSAISAFRKLKNVEHVKQPGLSAENGYDAVVAFSTAIRTAKTDAPGAVKLALLQVEFAGASGHVQFNSNRAVEIQPVLYEVKNGSLAKLGSKYMLLQVNR